MIATGYTAGVRIDRKNAGTSTLRHHVFRRQSKTGFVLDDCCRYYRVFPLGTILYIPGYGYGVVADIGGAIKGNKIDLYFETVQDVYKEWGKKEVEVYVIKEGNGSITEEELKTLNENEALQVFREQIINKRKE